MELLCFHLLQAIAWRHVEIDDPRHFPLLVQLQIEKLDQIANLQDSFTSIFRQLGLYQASFFWVAFAFLSTSRSEVEIGLMTNLLTFGKPQTDNWQVGFITNNPFLKEEIRSR